MAGLEYFRMTFQCMTKRPSLRRYNLPVYRKCLNRIRLYNRAAVYPIIDWQGNLGFYIMHRNLERLRLLCKEYVKVPCAWIKIKYRKGSPSKFYYVYLQGFTAEVWHRRMKYGKSKWKTI
jgi:hypothetical protein